MSKVRVLVVDDSRVVRQMVIQALTMDPGISVVGEAADGVLALEEVLRLEPDVVILDVEMPRLGGLDVVRALHVSHPRLPIIMFSTRTGRGAKVTVDALLAGASDYVLKPTGMDGPAAAMKAVHDQLVPRINSLCRPSRPSAAAHQRQPAAVHSPGRQRVSAPHGGVAVARASQRTRVAVAARVIAIGASTGGPDALMGVLSALPAACRVPILVVQHMPPLFTSMFATRLDRTIPPTVSEGADGELLRNGHVYIAPGDHHMEVVQGPDGVVLKTSQSPREQNSRPSATVLLRSAAQVYGAGTVAVVLTGMGSDGLLGAQAVHDAGGMVLAQDEESSVVWGMPGAVVRAGLADAVLSPEALGRKLARESA